MRNKSFFVLSIVVLVMLFAVACTSGPEHTHDYNITKYDAINHWKECECGAKSEINAHVFSAWTVSAEGVASRSCDCGYTEKNEKAIAVSNIEELKNALAASDDETVFLTADINMTDAIRITGKTVIDLNSRTLDLKGLKADYEYSDAEGNAFTTSGGIVVDKSGSLTLTGKGTITSTDSLFVVAGSLTIEDGDYTVAGNAIVIRNLGTTVINGGNLKTNRSTVLFMYPASSQKINGGTFSTDGFYTVYINGTYTDKNTELEITGGEFNDFLYLAGYSKTRISGGIFTSASLNPVYIKSGEITIVGGTFSCNPNTYPYDYVNCNNGAFSLEGDVVIEACDYPGGNPSLNVEGGVFDNGLCYYVKPEHKNPLGVVSVDIDVANIKVNDTYAFKKSFTFTYNSGTSTKSDSGIAYFVSEEKADAFTMSTKLDGITITSVGAKESIRK